MTARGRRLVAVVSLVFLFWALPAPAREPLDLSDLERRAAEVAGQAGSRMEEFKALAEEIAKQHRRQVEEGLSQALPEAAPPERILIFLTLGPEPEQDLEKNRRMLQNLHAAAPEAAIAVRGLPAGMRNIEQFMGYLKKLSADAKLPPLQLDPTLFRKYGVSVAPTLILERQGEKVAEVRGLASPDWLRRQVAAGRKGDLGQMGPTSPLAERDLIEELQERLWAVDWEAKKQEAFARYWRRYRFVDLPEAREDRRFTVAAKYVVPHDIVLPDGTVAARQGQEYDLFQVVKPTFVLLVFDGAKPAHVAWAKAQAGQYQGKWRVKLLATRLPDRDNGWQSLENLERELQGPVYLLNALIQDRFQLKHVPAVVQPGAGCFEVREFHLAAGAADQAKNNQKGEADGKIQ